MLWNLVDRIKHFDHNNIFPTRGVLLRCKSKFKLLLQTKYGLRSKQNLKLILLKYLRQVVAEYERAVLFRLGRIKSGGAKGPGINFSFTLKILILI